MKKSFLLLVSATVFCASLTVNAEAEMIAGRLGIGGNVGFNLPTDSKLNDSIGTKLKADGNFAAGGSLIYGITDILAIEAEVTYVPNTDFNNSGQKVFEMETIIPSIGLQIRNNLFEEHVSAYLGGGVDFLFASPKDNAGNTADVDTIVGGHVHGGGDYFISRNLALNLDLRGIFFGNADIKVGGTTIAKYDPICFVATVGLKWFPW
jgi:outer membrane protein